MDVTSHDVLMTYGGSQIKVQMLPTAALDGDEFQFHISALYFPVPVS
jgi:hypothetical protein